MAQFKSWTLKKSCFSIPDQPLTVHVRTFNRTLVNLTPNSGFLGKDSDVILIRRRLVAAALYLPVHALAQTCGKLTEPQTEGPFFRPSSPLRKNLMEKDANGRLVLTGTVLSAQCKPVANALLDFWHADEAGAYDNRGFRYRGHQFTDAQGRYRLETIVPAEYPGRARHLHVKVQAPGRRILTTQLYFPNQPGNTRDSLFSPDLVMQMKEAGQGSFDFVAA